MIDLGHIPMNERCLHNIDIGNMKCTKCRGSYWTVKTDPRPANRRVEDNAKETKRVR